MKKVKSLLVSLARKITESFYCTLACIEAGNKSKGNFLGIRSEIEKVMANSGFDLALMNIQRDSILKKNLVEVRNLLSIW